MSDDLRAPAQLLRVVAADQPQSKPHCRYQNLLKTIEVASDRETHGDFCDYGYWSGPSYHGYDQLPAGYWVYVAPQWLISVVIYETYNPGAVDHVSGCDADGKEVDLWTGADPTPAGKGKGISVIALQPDFDVSRIRISLDSQKVAGWNEIDAVGLLDAAGKFHWATSATASSTYADVLLKPAAENEVLRLRNLGGGDDGAIRKEPASPIQR